MIREVNKRLLLVIGLVVLILVVILFVFGIRREKETGNTTPDGTPVLQSPRAEVIDDTWNKITYPMDGVSVQIPQKWNTQMYDTLKDGIISIYVSHGTTVDFYLTYDSREHASNIEWYTRGRGYSIVYEGDSVNGALKYFGLASIGAIYGGDLNLEQLKRAKDLQRNSYVVGRILPFQSGSLLVHCQTYGTGYTSFINECNNVVESLIIK